MNLKNYFTKLREAEKSISDPYPVIVLLDTPDGAKGGVTRVVSREIAASLLVDDRAVLASEEEAEAYRENLKRQVRESQEAEAARQVQIAIVSSADLQAQFSGKKQNSPVNGK